VDFEHATTDAGWSDAEADAFIELVAGERRTLARQRFAGLDPVLKGPAGARAAKTLARLLAADREGALLATGDGRVNPSEDRAEEALQRAIQALSGWGFDTVRRELAIAAGAARAPARQQRIGAIRALAGVARAVVFTPPGERLRGEEVAARGFLARADVLPGAERDHDEAEVARLLAAWREAATDAATWRAWALLRGRLALRAGADESALAWVLRAWDRRDADAPAPDTDPALAGLVASARAVFRPLADGPDAATEDGAESPRAADVLLAIASALAGADGAAEPLAATARFAFIPFHGAPEPEAEEVAT